MKTFNFMKFDFWQYIIPEFVEYFACSGISYWTLLENRKHGQNVYVIQNEVSDKNYPWI